MTVDEELRELAEHELDVMRGRLEEMACQWESINRTRGHMADMVERQTRQRHTERDGQRDMLAACLRQLRNILAGRDAEDDGR